LKHQALLQYVLGLFFVSKFADLTVSVGK
jgi:hypothetical protein